MNKCEMELEFKKRSNQSLQDIVCAESGSVSSSTL